MTPLGPNVGICEQRVKRYAEVVAKRLGVDLVDFWAAAPCVHQCVDISTKEVVEEQAWFGVVFSGDCQLGIYTLKQRLTIHIIEEDMKFVDDTTHVSMMCVLM